MYTQLTHPLDLKISEHAICKHSEHKAPTNSSALSNQVHTAHNIQENSMEHRRKEQDSRYKG